MARIGEKEWYFYVPRDRKYRNGDRPNRVTRSGYWKATGADRMVKGEAGQRPIGLKKTLVFYGGKAPKGVRSSWIMNEYRLPHTTADHASHPFYHIHKTEISLCRVYKRAGVEDHCQQLPGTLNPKPSSSSSSQGVALFSPTDKKHPPPPPAALLHSLAPPKPPEKISDLLPSLPIMYGSTMTTVAASVANSLSSTASMEEDTSSLAHQYHSKPPPLFPDLLASATKYSISDELDRAITGYGNGESLSTMMDQRPNHGHQLVLLHPPHEQILPAPLNQYLSLPMISEKLWEWWNCNPNPTVSDAGKVDFTGFK